LPFSLSTFTFGFLPYAKEIKFATVKGAFTYSKDKTISPLVVEIVAKIPSAGFLAATVFVAAGFFETGFFVVCAWIFAIARQNINRYLNFIVI
jgi:hypothetical protein